MEKEWKKELILFFQGMGMGINSFFKSRNEEWELIPFFEWEWEWDYNPKNEGMDPCLIADFDIDDSALSRNRCST